MLTKHKALCVTSIALSLFIGGCAGDNCPPAAISDHTVVRTVETQRPCAVAVPARPAPLEMPLPTDAVALAAVLAMKLRDYAAPGKYADQMDSALRTCEKP